jgi:hypothetical protein
MFNLNKPTFKINSKNSKYMLDSISKYANQKKIEFEKSKLSNDLEKPFIKILEKNINDNDSATEIIYSKSIFLILTAFASCIFYIYNKYKK